MADRDLLTAVRNKMRGLMMEAHQRGEEQRPDDLPSDYWYGVQFGLETAIDLLEAAKIANQGVNLGED